MLRNLSPGSAGTKSQKFFICRTNQQKKFNENKQGKYQTENLESWFKFLYGTVRNIFRNSRGKYDIKSTRADVHIIGLESNIKHEETTQHLSHNAAYHHLTIMVKNLKS
jgi:hypothetical protein